MKVLLVCRLPNGHLYSFKVEDWDVANAKRAARDDGMPCIAVVRPKLQPTRRTYTFTDQFPLGLPYGSAR